MGPFANHIFTQEKKKGLSLSCQVESKTARKSANLTNTVLQIFYLFLLSPSRPFTFHFSLAPVQSLGETAA